MLSQILLALKPVLSLVLMAVLLMPGSTLAVRGPLDSQSGPYSVEQVFVGGATEYRFKLGGRHFGTLIDEDGTYALRPHPGCDINGWGSTWYAQPFLPGAALKHTAIGPIDANPSGIHVEASGQVSRGVSETYGTWRLVMDFSYDPLDQAVTGAGQYTITLAGQLGEATGDLNLYRIASNYLDDVPLLTGGSGDTGDMKAAVVRKDPGAIWFTWIPPDQPAHFPTDKTEFLSIDVAGQLNNVDTEKQGYAPIAPAFKPSLKVTLSSPRVEM